ncbi:MAG: flagellar hook-basal body complex protein FliE [Pseudolabrys sp.]|nr:flagellar hook-basal body complex protein FliE [Pseudolabrys sp.]MBV9259748.1 flagellar hook-basal body complex protein FliE [Pseudolabrys sp.]
MASPISAANAYAAIARLTNPASAGDLAGAAPQGGGDFTSALKEALASVAETGHKSDVQTKSLVNGKGDLVNVVTAVSETEVAIDAVVAVRDKVIAAYEDIMKMPI